VPGNSHGTMKSTRAMAGLREIITGYLQHRAAPAPRSIGYIEQQATGRCLGFDFFCGWIRGSWGNQERMWLNAGKGRRGVIGRQMSFVLALGFPRGFRRSVTMFCIPDTGLSGGGGGWVAVLLQEVYMLRRCTVGPMAVERRFLAVEPARAPAVREAQARRASLTWGAHHACVHLDACTPACGPRRARLPYGNSPTSRGSDD
jgi:hypothetical protein